MMLRRISIFVRFLTLFAVALPAAAQLGNSSLHGAYSFRYLGVSLGTSSAPCSDCPVSFIGTVTFDGNGGFTVSGQGNYVNSSGASQTLTPAASGTYTVYSSGMFAMANPFAAANSQTFLFGGVGQGAVVASSTESNNIDTFVAFPAATTASNATLSGSYQVGSLEFAGGAIGGTRNTVFTMTADGNGGLGNVSIAGTSLALNNANATTTQVSSGATYSVTANGSGTMTFPAPSGVATASQLLSGAKTLYISQDGSLFVAGTPAGYDLIVGIKAMPAGSSNPPVQGLYFITELENYYTTSSEINGYQGATHELGNQAGTELLHLRTNSDSSSSPFDQTFDFSYTFNSAGVSGTPSTGVVFAAGGNGNLYIVAGGAGDYYLGLGVKLQPMTGSGVFLYPYGVQNAATNAPFTAQLSPGEAISLYGTGLAPAGTNAKASAPFPNTLAGVGVTINGTPAPVFYVTPTQINAVVPYSLDPTAISVLTVQVTNNGTPSNSVTEYLGLTSPGVFTVPAGGIGSGAVLHADYSLVSTSSPAKAGETIQIFLTGLGTVSPGVNAGAAAPSSPLSQTVSAPQVYLTDPSGNFVQPVVAFSGLAPGLGGLYQLNVTIPAGVGVGVNTLEVDGPDAVTFQATIPIGQ